MTTVTDYVNTPVSGVLRVPNPVWVRLHSNIDATDYFSSAQSDVTTGTWTVAGGVKPDDYSMYIGSAATVPGTPTLVDAHFRVGYTRGDDVAVRSLTASSSPYSATAVAGGGDYSAAVRFGGNNPWNDVTHPSFAGGAVHDGSTDDQPAILAAIAAGGITYYPNGTYRLITKQTGGGLNWHLPVSADNSWHVGQSTNAVLKTTLTDTAIFHIDGCGKPAGMTNWATYAWVGLTVLNINPATKGAPSITTVTPADAGNFSVGDYIFIRTGNTLGASATANPDSEINQVISVNAGTGVIGLRWPLSKPYQQENYNAGSTGVTSVGGGGTQAPLGCSVIQPEILVNCRLLNLGLDSSLQTTSACINGGHFYDVRIEGCSATFGKNLVSIGNFRTVRYFRNNVRHLAAAGTADIVFTVGSIASNDVWVCDNEITSDGICFIHCHEGGAGSIIERNQIMVAGTTALTVPLIDIRNRVYDLKIEGNRLFNGDTLRAQIYCNTDQQPDGLFINGNEHAGVAFGAILIAAGNTTGVHIGVNQTGSLTVIVPLGSGNKLTNGEVARGATEMAVTAAGPVLTLTATSRLLAWDQRHLQTDTVAFNLRLPPEWLTYFVILYWISEAGGAGNVRWNVTINGPTNGVTYNQAADYNKNVTAAGGTQYVLTETSVSAQAGTAPADGVLSVRVARLGSDGADTLAGNTGLVGVVFQRAS